MHNLRLIRRRFPRQANAIIAGLAALSLAALVLGLALLVI